MDVFTNVVATHASRKEYDMALQKCDQQLAQVGDNPGVAAIIFDLKGGLYLAQGDKSQAEASYRLALEKEPNFMRPFYELARIYLADKKEDQAIDQYTAILAKDPKQLSAHMMLGTIYDVQRRFDMSEKHYRKALDLNPNFAPAANNLAYLLAAQDKDVNEALVFARKAKEKLPNDPNVMDTLGLVYYKKGFYDNAIAEFRGSLEKIPENATVHYHLGMAYYKKGESDRARTSLKKALRLDANFDHAEEAKKVLAEL